VPFGGELFLMGAALPASAPTWLLAVVMIPVGIYGTLAVHPTTAVLLDSVPAHRSGVASGVFNTSRHGRTYIGPMVGDTARAATLKLVPR
jgi:hypothetical protein